MKLAGGGGEYPNQKQFDSYVQEAQQQMQYIPPMQETESYEEVSVSEDLLDIVADNVPGWFIASSFVVGAITIGIMAIKFSPLKKYLAGLFKMWGNFLKS